MKVILRYFRQHPWQRRALTGSMAAILGVVLAWIIWPGVRDRNIINMLGSKDPQRRLKGIAQAVAVGRVCPELIERIEKKLDSADDLQFSAMVTVLDRLGLFYTPARKGYQIDRFRQITFATAPKNPTGTDVKRIMLHGIILDGRDNRYVRRALQLAMQDNAADIRSQAGLLAGRLRDYASLMKLLRDSNPSVRASSAIVAGLAGLENCKDTIAELLKTAHDEEEIPAFTFALAKLAPKKFSKEIIETIDRVYQSWRDKNDKDDLALLEKLLFSASLLKDLSLIHI